MYSLAELIAMNRSIRKLQSWWAEKVGKSSIIPKDNIQLGIEHRQYVMQENKAKHVDDQVLTQITDPYCG